MRQERRKFKRFDAFMSVKLKSSDGVDAAEVSLSNDLSREGMKITTAPVVDCGHLVDLEINIPDDPKPVHTTGEIAWVKSSDGDYALGVKFLMMDPVDKFRVLDYAYNNWLENKVNDFQDEEGISDI